MSENRGIKNALISVFNKDGLVPIVRKLNQLVRLIIKENLYQRQYKEKFGGEMKGNALNVEVSKNQNMITLFRFQKVVLTLLETFNYYVNPVIGLRVQRLVKKQKI